MAAMDAPQVARLMLFETICMDFNEETGFELKSPQNEKAAQTLAKAINYLIEYGPPRPVSPRQIDLRAKYMKKAADNAPFKLFVYGLGVDVIKADFADICKEIKKKVAPVKLEFFFLAEKELTKAPECDMILLLVQSFFSERVSYRAQEERFGPSIETFLKGLWFFLS